LGKLTVISTALKQHNGDDHHQQATKKTYRDHYQIKMNCCLTKI